MCLYVTKKNINGSEAVLQKVVKYLVFVDKISGYETPFQDTKVPMNGILVPNIIDYYAANKDLKKNIGTVFGGYIHSYNKKIVTYLSGYPAYAINIEAYGNADDLISSFLYIPEADKTNLRNKRIEVLEDLLCKKISLEKKWGIIRDLFPKYVDYFKLNKYYKIEQANRKVKDTMKKSEKLVVDWQEMLNHVSHTELANFADRNMNVRTFESLGSYPRKIVRALGAEALRSRIQKSRTRILGTESRRSV